MWNRTEGLERAEGTVPDAAKVILSFKGNPLRELSSDSWLDLSGIGVWLQETTLEGTDSCAMWMMGETGVN